MTMKANDFIVCLKATGTENDLCNLQLVFEQYKSISGALGAIDKGSFALNVLCILCRNLEKVPSWRDSIDGKTLVSLSIDCVRETRTLAHGDQVKTLACIYHIHKHVVKSVALIPPELVLKLSYMPFDESALLEEYCKTYWNILADRIMYIEQLKAKHSVTKLFQRLAEDAVKVIQIYDSVQFCMNILTFLVKKLYYIYTDSNTKDLSKVLGIIFNTLLRKQDVSTFKKLKDREILDIYIKISDCIHVVAENASKNNFKNSVLDIAVRTAITMLGHNSDVMRCLETFFLNGFFSIFEDTSNVSNIENILTNMLTSCIAMEKNGQEKVINATYPFINQLLRLYIEYSVANIKSSSTIYFNENIQIVCLNFILYLSNKRTDQQIKCENCNVKSGFHDSLRLLFLIKHFPATCIAHNIVVKNMLPTYYKLVLMQHKILFQLKKLGCSNHEKYFRKLQTDIHNTAISLNKAAYYEYSIKLFNVYIEFELRYLKGGNVLKNVSRALHNKSICELDCKLYNEAVIDAFLSLIFSLPDGLNSEKYMSLVMDIKAKSLKQNNTDLLQSISVLEACKISLDERKYGNLEPFFIDLNFSELLRHEFSMYSKLWPSIAPISGVWCSLADLLKNNQPDWVKVEPKEIISCTLYEIILETPMIVRTIHDENFCAIITELAAMLEDTELPPEMQFIHSAVLFLKCEFDLHEASQKHDWKPTEPTMDPDQARSIRTIAQEYEASKSAVKAVHILSRAVKHFKQVPNTRCLQNALRLYQIFVVQLLHLYKTVEALQLAYYCCGIAEYVGDSESYVINASVIISHADKTRPEVMRLLSTCTSLWSKVSLQTALCFACDAAIYYYKCGSVGVTARLLQLVQFKLLKAHQQSDVNLDLALGRLCEAQYLVCGSSNTLSTATAIQRHYLGISNTETKWCPRRHLAVSVKRHISSSGVATTRTSRSLLLWRRARCACAASLPAASATAHAQLFALITNAHNFNDAQSKIDNRLKHILGLQPSNEPQLHIEAPSKPELFTPKNELETMLENVVFKKTQTSPSIPCTSVYGHKTPDFLYHKQCSCCLCDNAYSSIIACLTSGLESSIYFRAKEFQIARNYFEGSLKNFALAESKLQSYFNKQKNQSDDLWLIDIVKDYVFDNYYRVYVEFLVEATFFELSQELYEKADDLIVRMYEIMQVAKNLDHYVKNEVYNVVTTSARLKKGITVNLGVNLEVEMENLKLSPKHEVEAPKTPELKPKAPPKLPKNIVKAEEVPNVKRKVIKLNLDDTEEKDVVKPGRKRTEFKIPIPVTSKAVLESITPRTRSKPAILVSKPSVEVEITPKSDKTEFFTPTSTPEQFFTPMTSMKTYSKKSLRQNIVKNLETEFATPKRDKENSTMSTGAVSSQIPTVNARTTRSKVAKTNLKRATSPGKLVKETTTRSKVKTFSILEDDKK